MIDNKTKEELIRRYKYLYENIDLILSMCIQKQIHFSQTYYIIKDIPTKIVTLFENYLFSDESLKQTRLYTLIEKLKNDKMRLTYARDKISYLLRRRNQDSYLRHINCLTVWKVLTCVRNNNKDNQAVLDALDVYYNIDRSIRTGVNWSSGYYLSDEDVANNADYINIFHYDTNPGEIDTNHERVMTINYQKSQIEKEDNYFASKPYIDFIEPPKINQNLSQFMSRINQGGILSPDDKYELYLAIHGCSPQNNHQRVLTNVH